MSYASNPAPRCSSGIYRVELPTHTDNALDGNSAMELTKDNYGHDEWWLLLDPVAE